MSKWINKNLFNQHLEEREKEKQSSKAQGGFRSENVWPTPAPGTQEEPQVYEGRFLPDTNDKLVKKYLYHTWKSGDRYYTTLCPKTYDFGTFCPFCTVVSSLYVIGTPAEKLLARQMKRKERYVANWYIVEDPRDKNAKDENAKMKGKVRLYQLPGKVNEKLVAEEDEKEGLREAAWDPGDEGHNFIIKVKLTKPDAEKNQFPDYSSSTFSRKANALGNDKEIKAIMASVHSLDEHIKAMEKDERWMKETLISEGLFKLIEKEWNRHYKDSISEPETESDDVQDFPSGSSNSKETDQSEEELLKALNDIK